MKRKFIFSIGLTFAFNLLVAQAQKTKVMIGQELQTQVIKDPNGPSEPGPTAANVDPPGQCSNEEAISKTSNFNFKSFQYSNGFKKIHWLGRNDLTTGFENHYVGINNSEPKAVLDVHFPTNKLASALFGLSVNSCTKVGLVSGDKFPSWVGTYRGLDGNGNQEGKPFQIRAGLANEEDHWGEVQDGALIHLNPTGHVGVGNDNPLSNLHIGQHNTLYTDPANSFWARNWAWYAGIGQKVDGTQGTGLLNVNSSGGISFYNAAPSETNVTEKVTIDNIGNVGIGTPNPLDRLHVVGRVFAENLRLSGLNGNLGVGLLARDANGDVITQTNAQVLPSLGITGIENRIARFGANNSLTNSNMAEDPITQNIGIGTFTPNSRLHVRQSVVGATGTTENNLLRLSNDWNNFPGQTVLASLSFDNGITPVTHGWKMKAAVTNENYFQLTNTIGSTPVETAVLTLNNEGDMFLGTNNNTIATTSNRGKRLYFDGAQTMSSIAANNSDPLFIERFNEGDNRSVLRINVGDDADVNSTNENSDKISIGSYHFSNNSWRENIALYGNGSIFARSVNVQLTAYPDYVFKPGYKVRTLEETEQFIKENGHLPEMPSAKEVETNGADLGELHKALLKQVEELTLQLIALKKELSQVKDSK